MLLKVMSFFALVCLPDKGEGDGKGEGTVRGRGKRGFEEREEEEGRHTMVTHTKIHRTTPIQLNQWWLTRVREFQVIKIPKSHEEITSQHVSDIRIRSIPFNRVDVTAVVGEVFGDEGGVGFSDCDLRVGRVWDIGEVVDGGVEHAEVLHPGHSSRFASRFGGRRGGRRWRLSFLLEMCEEEDNGKMLVFNDVEIFCSWRAFNSFRSLNLVDERRLGCIY